MKFCIVKLPKTFLNIPKKSLKAKQKKQKIQLNRGEKSKCKSLLRWKTFVTRQIVILKVKIEPVSITAAANYNEHILRSDDAIPTLFAQCS